MAPLLNMLPEQAGAPQVVPAGAGVHVPTEPALLQLTQGPPVQALLQQTPPTQKPLWQPALLAHAAPSGAARCPAHWRAASSSACPALVSPDAVVSSKKKPTRRSGAVNPTICEPFS
jgi:hypothetical protein